MNFQYYPVGSSKAKVESVTDLKIAAYILTEWLPTVPTNIINGFAEVIKSILIPIDVDNAEYWHVNPDLAITDRQYKSMTSWLIGVAFARFVIESEGYQWWSPVSAFKDNRSGGLTTTGNWLPSIPSTHFRVSKNPRSPARFMPDYVVCRLSSSRDPVYAFVESKGTAKLPRVLPEEWRNQLYSAELTFKGLLVIPSRYLLVATRVNPTGSKDERAIIVRSWNSVSPSDSENDLQFAHFLANHYVGICRRLGFDDLADLIDVAGMDMVNRGLLHRSDQRLYDPSPANSLDSIESLQNRLNKLVTSIRPLNHEPELLILDADSPQSRIHLGGQIYSASLTSAALGIIRSLVSQNISSIKEIVSFELQHIQKWNDHYRREENPGIQITPNGVVVRKQN